MERKSLLNQLELGYAPLTAYEFAITKNDIFIERALKNASLYIIAQRPVITFENVSVDENSYSLIFEIHQKENSNIIKGKLPLIQKAVDSNDNDTIAVAFNYLDKKSETQNSFPLYNIHGFSLVNVLENENKFLIWFSPEKLLQNWWKGNIECELYGDFRSFTIYKVHYVGKATRQSILKRLTGHNTLQDILSLESPVTEKQLPANEIVILPFEFKDNLQFQVFGKESTIENMVSSLKGENYPKQEKVFLDAEKALIKAMQPQYNKELFKSYPISKDGLYNDNYDTISYTFIDPITLKYSEGEILGCLTNIGGDSIIISNNKDFKLVKHQE
ncbi:hypothetical protein HNP99_003557 [Flavobacterium sp. 28A]|uniref:hypothetical protein n=1 Tax=Flavobacterium sp. 28A TaxID=2735895 RepID=UPI0015715089|nr:hypothetical protein [Flavobacterium sp. 28A]NRT17178.1 hypothetical protein [Flavobacterium sp. 28A]